MDTSNREQRAFKQKPRYGARPGDFTHRPFAERLATFASNVDKAHAGEVFTPSRMQFWALERSWERTPPKGREFIRRMPWRIRHWVRWGGEVRRALCNWLLK